MALEKARNMRQDVHCTIERQIFHAFHKSTHGLRYDRIIKTEY